MCTVPPDGLSPSLMVFTWSFVQESSHDTRGGMCRASSCCTTMRGQESDTGKNDNIWASAWGPPVDEPMTTIPRLVTICVSGDLGGELWGIVGLF